MIHIIEGDLFEAKEGLLCHQVNCKGVMGRGVAKTFKEKFPMAFAQYAANCETYRGISDELLGLCSFYRIEDDFYTCCMFAQDDYRGSGVKTNYAAFEECCDNIKRAIESFGGLDKSSPINMPYNIGCGLAGGDWSIIYSILDEQFKDYNLILYKL